MDAAERGLAVIFDMDGVILDTERLAAVCWGEVGKDWGLDGIIDVLDRCTGVTERVSRQVFAEAYGDAVSYDAFQRAVKARASEKCPNGVMPVKDGAADLLSALRAWGVKTALASSTEGDTVAAELKGVGLYAYFDALVCGDMVSASKPAPDIFLMAAKRLGADPADCWVFEDSHNGIRAAHAAGMHPVMIPDRMPVTDEMRALSEMILPSLRDAQRMLAGRFGFSGGIA